MKFTNIKQLIIKFMGGGIINFPTRFLRWVKIDGDTDGSDDGGGDGGGGGEDDKTGLINCFPYHTKVVGFIENYDNQQGFNYNSYSRTATLTQDRPFIPIEEIEEYVLNKETQWSGEYGFSPVIEYDELAFEDDFNGHDLGIANWNFYLGGVESNKKYIQVYSTLSDYLMSGKAMKLTIEGKDYMVFAVLSD